MKNRQLGPLLGFAPHLEWLRGARAGLLTLLKEEEQPLRSRRMLASKSLGKPDGPRGRIGATWGRDSR